MHEEHEHQYTHSHPHDESHDHHHHDHGDTHSHTHVYQHHHDHDEPGHTHPELEHCHSDCTSCEGCNPMDELKAMMKYMVSHNTAHANELASLAKQLEQAGNHSAYEQVMLAVSDFEKGNLRLSATLAALE